MTIPKKSSSFSTPAKRANRKSVKKKHFCNGRTFSCFAAHLIEQDLFSSKAERGQIWRFAELGVRFSYFGGCADWFSLVGGTIPFSRR
jgi:hypothetical protein